MAKNKRGVATIAIVGGILALILTGALGFSYYSITHSKTIDAQLHVESGIVKVNGNEVNGNVLLNEGDLIETLDGEATAILFESVIVNIYPNTKITVQELTNKHPKLEQEGGKTWNKFTGLSGVEEYSIKEGNSVASVRATAFELSSGKIITGEGEVEYVIDGKRFTVREGRVVERADGEIIERAATPEELANVKEHMQKSIEELRYLRQLEIEKHPVLAKQLKKKYYVSDMEIKQYLEEADDGMHDVDAMVEKSPVKIESVYKIAEITKAIQMINKDVKQVNSLNANINAPENE